MTDLLFNGITMHEFLDKRERSLQALVQNATSKSLEGEDNRRALVTMAVDKMRLQAPELDIAGMTADHEEVPMRSGYGMKLRLHLPVSGSPDLLHVQPSTFSFNPPHGSVSEDELLLEITIPSSEMDADSVKMNVDGTIRKVKTYLGYLRDDCSAWNDSLNNKVNRLITQRRRRLGEQSRILEAIGIPRHQGVPPTG